MQIETGYIEEKNKNNLMTIFTNSHFWILKLLKK